MCFGPLINCIETRCFNNVTDTLYKWAALIAVVSNARLNELILPAVGMKALLCSGP